ncbi:hypothetical protein MGYG_03920 [Nannizzia gypsea CBS 118893]|uniref:Apple domain-containing protein n=1 Tax=Arthroderma gypseum (strain ATCC MYA-4604 / CBS 118893) TaxID=535722 RepID=E4UUF0_ARTGP|nr:hypothetical protein MGYG_03920 [Nannizzia gypsea CBS 118893]EFR00917.1 hypothetical protein MGYG_03920 [Nannizzia gypsea CBS 118893]
MVQLKLNAGVINGVCVLSALLSYHGMVYAQGDDWDLLMKDQGSQPAPAVPPPSGSSDPWDTLGGGSGGSGGSGGTSGSGSSGGSGPHSGTDPWDTLSGGSGGSGGTSGGGSSGGSGPHSGTDPWDTLSGGSGGTGGSGSSPGTGTGGSSTGGPSLGHTTFETTTAPNCDADNGKVYEAADGSWFKIECVTHNWFTSTKNRVSSTSYQNCVDQCSSTPGCDAVNFEKANGNCDLMQGPYDPNDPATKNVPCQNHHFAYTIDPPTYPAPVQKKTLCSVECPDADGMIYTTDHGEVFKMTCGMRHGTSPIGGAIVNSLKECMDECSAVLQCHSVDYHPRTRKCYQSNHQSDPSIQASGFASAHSLGCANACNGGCGGGCSGTCQKKVVTSSA